MSQTQSFEVEVVRTDLYRIELDPEIINDEWMADWSRVFHYVDSHEDVLKAVASTIMRNGLFADFYEGFGYLKIKMSDGTIRRPLKNGNPIEEKDMCQGIIVKSIDHDDNYEYNIK